MSASAALRICVLILLPLAVAGCFKSKAPLIDQEQAVFPFQTLKMRNDNGEASLKRSGNAYVYSEFDEDQASEPESKAIMIYEIQPDLFIIQDTEESGSATYLFAKRKDDSLLVRSVCDGLDRKTREKYGVTDGAAAHAEPKRKTDNCYFTDLKSMAAFAQLPTLWAEKITTLQIVSIE